jgi:type V secretory pathway adhesin AidA
MEMQKQVDANRQEWEARQKTLELQQQAQLEAQRQQYETEREAMRLDFERWKVEYTAAVDMKKHDDAQTMLGMNHAREDMRQEREAARFQATGDSV